MTDGTYPYYLWHYKKCTKNTQSVMVLRSDSPEVREAKYILYGKNVRYEGEYDGRSETNEE